MTLDEHAQYVISSQKINEKSLKEFHEQADKKEFSKNLTNGLHQKHEHTDIISTKSSNGQIMMNHSIDASTKNNVNVINVESDTNPKYIHDGDSLADCKIMAPVVFQCKKCRTVIGDSLHLHSIDPNDRIIILNAITDAIKVNEEPVMQPNKSSFDFWSVFLPLVCSFCNEMLGKCYQCGNKNIYHLIDKYIFNADLIDCYELGSTRGQNRQTNDEIFDIPTSLHLQKQIIKIIKFTISIKEDSDFIRSSIDSLKERVSSLEKIPPLPDSNASEQYQKEKSLANIKDESKRSTKPVIRFTCDPSPESQSGSSSHSKENSPASEKRLSISKISLQDSKQQTKRVRSSGGQKQSPLPSITKNNSVI